MTDKTIDHATDTEIIEHEIESGMARWERILEFNKKEIGFLSNLLLSANGEEIIFLQQAMETQKKANLKCQNLFMDFKNKLENRRECDDIECDTQYLKQYFGLKEILLKQFQEFREQKSNVYALFDK